MLEGVRMTLGSRYIFIDNGRIHSERGREIFSLSKGQTGKHVVRAEDLPRANKLLCAQRPIKCEEFEKHA